MPPIIGAAMRFMTSAPVPVVHMIGSNPPLIAARVILRPHPLDRAFHHGFAKGYPLPGPRRPDPPLDLVGV
jgi:hypothetical protein